MGQHDPLDGFITCHQLEATARWLPGAARGPDLAAAMTDFARLIGAGHWATADPLGIGGLLIDASRVAQLAEDGTAGAGALLEPLLAAALEGLAQHARQADLCQPAERRLAFRELGLAIGLSAVPGVEEQVHAMRVRFPEGVQARVDSLARYAGLGSAIESFWRDPEHRRNRTWTGHRDINEVMLATCLLPDGLLRLARVG
jgi:hypothetical protein